MMAVLKKIGAALAAFLPHLLLAYGLMLLTFFVINCVNTSMMFLDSRISQRFELFYAALNLLLAVICFVKKRVRIPAAAAAVIAVAFVVPVFSALKAGNAVPLDNAYFRIMALISALATLTASVMVIVKQRRDARAAYALAGE